MPRSTKIAPPRLKHVKHVRRGSRVYSYFNTGRKDDKGQPIRVAMPDINDPSFYPTYGSLCAGRTRRDNIASLLTLPDLIALFRKSEKWRKLAPASQNIYSIYLGQMAEAFGKAPADDIKRADMIRLLDSMADRPGAANALLKAAGSLYAWARSREHVAARPCDDIDLFELGEHDPWPVDLLDKALAADDPFVKLAVHLLYYTGQRIGDVSKMRWSDYRDGRIEIRQEKTGAIVSIPPHPELARLLATTPRAGLTILAEDAKPFDRAAIRDRLKKWAAGHGVPIVPHGLRKNAVNALLEAGCSAAEAAAITRQSLQLVEHYAKARDTRKLADTAVLKWSGTKNDRGNAREKAGKNGGKA